MGTKRVALEFFSILEELLPSITQVGGYFRMRLDELARKRTVIKEVRGSGLMLGVELTQPCKDVVSEAMREGLLINCTHDTVLRLLPPYILTEQDVDRAMLSLRGIFDKLRPTPAMAV